MANTVFGPCYVKIRGSISLPKMISCAGLATATKPAAGYPTTTQTQL